MDDPIAFFITIATYGTWLPGDQRGWIEYHKGWQLPEPVRELEAAAKMSEDAKILNPKQRELVQQQVHETCDYRKWICHAVNCRTNHMHAVVGALETPPKKVRARLESVVHATTERERSARKNSELVGRTRQHSVDI